MTQSRKHRLEEAYANGWAGEIDGLHISITAAEQKLEQLRLARSVGGSVVLVDAPPFA